MGAVRFWRVTVRTGRFVLMGMVMALMLFSGVAPSAHAKKAPKTHFKFNKHSGLFGGNYLAPKKQKKPTGYYQSTVTGKMVYGKPKK